MTEDEAARRRDEVIKRMLATPPQPRKPTTKKGAGEPAPRKVSAEKRSKSRD